MKELLSRIENLRTILKISQKQEEIAAIEEEMNSADFWLDETSANSKTKRLKNLKDEIKQFVDVSELSELAESDEDIQLINDKVLELEKLALFSGKYDGHSAVMNFYAGAGGDDAQDWTEMLMRMYLRWAENHSYGVRIIDESRGGIAGIKSATIEIDGSYVYGMLKHENGVHRLVRQSPFNAKALRQTSFSLVEVLPLIEDRSEVALDEKDLRIDTYRSSGKGGQGVNTTDSAVRITHLPTGITAACQNERSQLQNKETALRVLRSRLALMMETQQKEKLEELRGEQSEPEWGSQIRSYVLHPYKMVKDHRTDHEESDPNKVLEGELDRFIDAEIRWAGGLSN